MNRKKKKITRTKGSSLVSQIVYRKVENEWRREGWKPPQITRVETQVLQNTWVTNRVWIFTLTPHKPERQRQN